MKLDLPISASESTVLQLSYCGKEQNLIDPISQELHKADCFGVKDFC